MITHENVYAVLFVFSLSIFLTAGGELITNLGYSIIRFAKH